MAVTSISNLELKQTMLTVELKVKLMRLSSIVQLTLKRSPTTTKKSQRQSLQSKPLLKTTKKTILRTLVASTCPLLSQKTVLRSQSQKLSKRRKRRRLLPRPDRRQLRLSGRLASLHLIQQEASIITNCKLTANVNLTRCKAQSRKKCNLARTKQQCRLNKW